MRTYPKVYFAPLMVIVSLDVYCEHIFKNVFEN